MDKLWLKTLILALIGLGIGACMVLMSKARAVRPAERVPEIVFVDIERLERLHPNAEMLGDFSILKARLAGRSVDTGIGSEDNAIPSELPNGVSADVGEPIRQEMSRQVLSSTDQALKSWEEDRKRALSVRLDYSRKNMLARAQDAIWFNKNEVFEQAGRQKMTIELKYGLDLMNYRLAIRELELGSDIHGYKPPEIAPKLGSLRSTLDSLNKQYLGEHLSVDGWMQSEVDRISNETLADVNSVLSRERIRSTAAIQADVEKARARINSRLESVNSAKLKRLLVVPDVAAEAIVLVRPTVARKNVGKIDTAQLDRSQAKIRQQIREDLKSVIAEEAKSMGVKVVFSRSEAKSARDMTQEFADIIHGGVW